MNYGIVTNVQIQCSFSNKILYFIKTLFYFLLLSSIEINGENIFLPYTIFWQFKITFICKI